MTTRKTWKRMRRHIWVLLVLAGLVGTSHDVKAAEHQATPSARETLVIRCIRCHAPQGENGKLDAIEAQRKSPEGWSMTLSRMVRTHGVELQDGRCPYSGQISERSLWAGAQRSRALSLYSRAAQYPHHTGRAQNPSRPGCIQCHTYARIALQRRTQDSWGAAAGCQGRTHGEYRQ